MWWKYFKEFDDDVNSIS